MEDISGNATAPAPAPAHQSSSIEGPIPPSQWVEIVRDLLPVAWSPEASIAGEHLRAVRRAEEALRRASSTGVVPPAHQGPSRAASFASFDWPAATRDDPYKPHWVALASASEAVARSPSCTSEDAVALCAAIERLAQALEGD